MIHTFKALNLQGQAHPWSSAAHNSAPAPPPIQHTFKIKPENNKTLDTYATNMYDEMVQLHI